MSIVDHPDLKSARDITVADYSFMLYGATGSGKSHMIGTFPRPILVFNPVAENSIRTLRGDDEVWYFDLESYDQFCGYLEECENDLVEGTFPFLTVAVDSLSFLVDMMVDERRLAQGKKGLAQSDWGVVANHVKEIVRRVNAWPVQKIWTAGVDTEKDDLTGEIEGYPRMFRTLQRSVWGMMDCVLYLEGGKDPSGKPAWYAYTARHRYYSARVRGTPVPQRIQPSYAAVMKLMEKTLYGEADATSASPVEPPSGETAAAEAAQKE